MNADIQNHVVNYFNGERRELILILTITPIVFVLVSVLYWFLRDRFTLGLGLTIVLFGIAFSSAAASLLTRDKSMRETLISASTTQTNADQTFSEERLRIEKVIANYPYYRYGSVALVLIGFLIMFLMNSHLVNGVIVGLLIAASAQLSIDHYSEARALIYRSAIDDFLAK